MSHAIRMTPEQVAAHNAKISKIVRADAAKKRFQAKGRLASGVMNKSEAAYAQHLEAQKHLGRVLWYRFEGIKLRLADNTFLTMDFAVMTAEGFIELHDVKGNRAIVSDDARVKAKVAADQYPFLIKFVYPKPRKDGGGWDEEVLSRP